MLECLENVTASDARALCKTRYLSKRDPLYLRPMLLNAKQLDG